MYKENFTEGDIPYETLEKHGLTHAMIDDLPQSVMNKLLHGEFTPILPLLYKTETGDLPVMSRIALCSGPNNDVKVILKPKIETSSLGLYSEEQQETLKAGKTIIGLAPEDIENNENNGKCFIQYDEDTNQVLSVPTYAIGENMRTMTEILGLDFDTIKNLQQGEPQTVEWEENNRKEMLTFGIDLKTDSCIRIATGGLQEYINDAKDFKEKYNFGINGVWIASEDGKSGRYVSEENYDEDIKAALQRSIERNREAVNQNNGLKI